MSEARVIRVTGKGQIKVRPDMMRITMELAGTHRDYAETLRRSSQDTEQLYDILAGFGFAHGDLKTQDFSVDTEYEGYEERGVYKQRFIGYKYHHRLKVEFPSDNERLGKVLYALAHCSVAPEFRLSYTVKDREAAKNTLLGRAVLDAKAKAAVLAVAADVKLGAIQSIDYSWGEVDFEFQPMNRSLKMDELMDTRSVGASYDLDIEPDDIEVSDTVTVVWTIE